MSIFCLLWIPAFFFFRRSIAADSGRGYTWALLLGCLIVFLRYYFGHLVTPGGFGISRWFSSFVDIISLPVLIPFVIYCLLVKLRIFPAFDHTGSVDFILLSLVPVAAFHAISNPQGFPLTLVFVPLLWTAQGAGIPFFVNFIVHNPRWYIITFSLMGTIALPLMAATSWWAFFSHQTLLGSLLFSASLIPAIVSVIVDVYKHKR